MRILLLLIIGLSVVAVVAGIGYNHANQAPAATYAVTLADGKTVQWPPRVGHPYPDLELVDSRGEIVKLADFKGKVIIVEPVGMTCAACNAFSGGNEVGGFKGIQPQGGLDSIEKYFPQYTHGVSLHDDRIVFVQLLLYNYLMQGPTQEDAQAWAKHFGMGRYKNTYVLAGGPQLVGTSSYAMIPGFQLIDKDFILRSDATGDLPKQSIWTDLLPMVPQLLKE
ncbi:MAG: hypothetical protein GC185_13075 [Alphaproteobacteria bacterium]|nr:hypothetical protein [Alphaproteobacteria bacterium]